MEKDNSDISDLFPNKWYQSLGFLALCLVLIKMDPPSDSGVMIKLTTSNYSIWKPRMEDLLYCKDLFEPILGDVGKPSEITDEKWASMHRKTVGNTRQWVSQSIFHHVAKDTKADELWKKLENMYERKSGLNKSSLLKQITRLRYKEGADMSEHLSDFQGLINQATTLNLNLDDEVQALLLFSSLPDSWETMVVSVSNSAPNGVLTMAIAKDALLNEELRRKEQGIETGSQALVTEKQGRKGRSKSREPRNRDRSRGSSKSRRDVKCFYCSKMGHYKSECRLLKKEQSKEKGKGKKQEIKNEGETTPVVEAHDNVFVFCDDGCVNITCHDSDWVIDLGASFHVIPHRHFFKLHSRRFWLCQDGK